MPGVESSFLCGSIIPIEPRIGSCPTGDGVVILEEGRFRSDRQSGSSALESGRSKVWVIDFLKNSFHGLGIPELSNKMFPL